MKSYSTHDLMQLMNLKSRTVIDRWDALGVLRADAAPSRGAGAPRRYSFNNLVAAYVLREYTPWGVRPKLLAPMMRVIQDGPDLEYDYWDWWLVSDGPRFEWHPAYPTDSEIERTSMISRRIHISGLARNMRERLEQLGIEGGLIPRDEERAYFEQRQRRRNRGGPVPMRL